MCTKKRMVGKKCKENGFHLVTRKWQLNLIKVIFEDNIKYLKNPGR